MHTSLACCTHVTLTSKSHVAHDALYRWLEVSEGSLKVHHGHMGSCMQILARSCEGRLLAQIVKIRPGVPLCTFCKGLHSSMWHHLAGSHAGWGLCLLMFHTGPGRTSVKTR